MPARRDTKQKLVYFSPQEWKKVCKRAATLKEKRDIMETKALR